LLAVLCLFAFAGQANTEEKKARGVWGIVTDKRGNALNGAAVQIENLGNLSVASYITRADGRYYFHQLNPDLDFELTAKYKKWWSPSKILSKFNGSAHPRVDLVIPID
jgi:hypothetical protein